MRSFNHRQTIGIVVFVFLALGTFVPQGWAREAIAYTHSGEDGYWQIWTVSPDGSNDRVRTVSKVDKREPFLAPDGRIFYRTPNGQAFYLSKDGGEETEILAKYERVNNPQLLKDGTTVLFTRLDAKAKDIRDIWKADLNSEDASIVTRDNKMALQPSISADNTKIVFVKGDDTRTSHHVWIMNADGTSPFQLTAGIGQDLFARLSPDNKSVVYATNKHDGHFEIYLADVETRAVTRLTDSPGVDTQPCFSPDGSRIAFVSNRDGSQQIWVMDKSGLNARALTSTPGESFEPNWNDLNEE